jgi:hypothetical protein
MGYDPATYRSIWTTFCTSDATIHRIPPTTTFYGIIFILGIHGSVLSLILAAYLAISIY